MTKEVIKKEYIFTGMEVTTKEEALRAIAERAVELLSLIHIYSGGNHCPVQSQTEKSVRRGRDES